MASRCMTAFLFRRRNVQRPGITFQGASEGRQRLRRRRGSLGNCFSLLYPFLLLLLSPRFLPDIWAWEYPATRPRHSRSQFAYLAVVPANC